MKKVFFISMLMNMVSIQLSAHDIEVNGIYYYFNSDGTSVSVTYKGNSYDSAEYSGDVIIPASIDHDGKPYFVTSISNYAFNNCIGLISVTIPNSVTSIGEHAFFWCSGLTSVSIPNSVTTIGDSAFQSCSGLTSVTLGNSVTSIGQSAFEYCYALTSVHISDLSTWYGISFSSDGSNPLSYAHHLYTNGIEVNNVVIPNNVTSIGDYAFSGCGGLASVTIPNSVTSIGNSAFKNCSGLTSVTIPNSVISISEAAFSCCSGLGSINISNSVTTIGDYAFQDCTSLSYITIPTNVVSIGINAFCNCASLSSMNIPNSVTSIGGGAFAGCSGLTSVTISRNVTSINDYTFQGCYGLTSVIIPENVTEIGDNAFVGCSGLSSIIIPNKVTSIGNHAFRDCCGLNTVTFPYSLISIGEKAFSGCYKLSSVIFPNNLSSIGNYAFYGCKNEQFTSLSIPNSVNVLGNGAFASCYYLETLELGEDVSSVKPSTFSGCPKINEITSHIKEPLNMVKNAFADNVYETAKLVVPDGMMNKYLACDGWKDFVNIMEESQQESFMLTVNCNEGGEVSFLGQTVRNGNGRMSVNRNQSVTLTITPDEGYEVKSVLVNGEDVTDDLYNNTYTLAQIKENKNVQVVFAEKATYLSIQQAESGCVMQRVEKGKTYEYRFAPTNGWRVHSVTFNNQNVTNQMGSDNTFTTPAIEGNSTLIVVYERTNGQATAIREANGSPIQIQGNSYGVRITNAELNDIINVYSTDGKLVKSVTATSSQMDIPLERGQVYIIKVHEKVLKVKL